MYPGYKDTCFFTYIPVSDKPGFGLIRHNISKKAIHPYGGEFHPRDVTAVVLHPTLIHYGALWTVLGKSKAILHVGGQVWHPYDGSVNPADNTGIVVYPG